MIFIREDGNIIEAECENCGRILKLRKSNYWPYDKTSYHTTDPVVCFCEVASDKIIDVPQVIIQATLGRTQEQPSTPSTPKVHKPCCPTCGSENVEKIPLSSKAVGGAMFGIFSSNIRNTYRCRNCGYKW